MRTTLRNTAFAVATLVASTATAAPAVSASARPTPPACGDASADPSPVRFLLGFRPGDDLATAWCRLRAVGGERTLQVEFPDTGATRYGTIDLTDGPDALDVIQRLLPVERAKSVDADGQPFPKVLRRVSAGTVAVSPSGASLGLPPAFPGADLLALWEPLVLRVGPVDHKGSPFVLELVFDPSPARYLMAGTGRWSGGALRGATRRMVGRDRPVAVPLLGGDDDGAADACPDRLPGCGALGETATFTEIWALSKVTLRSVKGDLTRTAVDLVEALEAAHPDASAATLRSFDPYVGRLSYTRAKSGRRLRVKASPPEGGYGVAKVTVEWSDTKEGPDSWSKAMDRWFRESRTALLRHYGTGAGDG